MMFHNLKCTSKRRRDVINDTLVQLRDALPLSDDVIQRFSQLQTLSMACVTLRKSQLISSALSSTFSWPNTRKCPISTHSLCKALPGFLLAITAQGKIVYISENVSDYLGHSMIELMSQGDSLYDLIDKRDHRDVQQRLQHHLQQQRQSFSFLCRMGVSRNLRRRMGLGESRAIYMHGRYTTTSYSGDAIFMGMCVPVLGAGGQHSNLIPDENTLFCTATLTLDLKFLEASASILDILSLRCGRLYGKSLYHLIHPSDVIQLAEKHRQLMQGTSATAVVLRLVTNAGSVTWCNVTLYPPESRGAGGRVSCVIQVITEDAVDAFRTHNTHTTAIVAKDPEYCCSSTGSESTIAAAMEVNIIQLDGPVSASIATLPAKSFSCEYPAPPSDCWRQERAIVPALRYYPRSKSDPCFFTTARLSQPPHYLAPCNSPASNSSVFSARATSPNAATISDVIASGHVKVESSLSPNAILPSSFSNLTTNSIFQHQQQLPLNNFITTNDLMQPLTATIYWNSSLLDPFNQQDQCQGQGCVAVVTQPNMLRGSFVCIDSNQARVALEASSSNQPAAPVFQGQGFQNVYQTPPSLFQPSSIARNSGAGASSNIFLNMSLQGTAGLLPSNQNPLQQSQFDFLQGQGLSQGNSSNSVAQYAPILNNSIFNPTLTLSSQNSGSLLNLGTGSQVTTLTQSTHPLVGGGNPGYCSNRADNQSVTRPIPGSAVMLWY